MNADRLAELIAQAQQGSPEAFEALVDDFAPRLFGYLYRLVGSRDDAEDLLQEVFLRLVRMIGAYEHDGRFEGWLFRIATNLARDRIRRAGREPPTLRLESGGGDADDGGESDWLAADRQMAPAPDAPLVLREDVDALQVALAQLPTAEREVVMLRHYGQLSFAQIAEMMGTPLGTALARGHRGLARLRELMCGSEAESAPAG